MIQLVFSLLILISTQVLAAGLDNPDSYTNDGYGNAITSQVSGSQRSLDIGIDVSGVQVDPRARTWTLSSGTDSCSSVQFGTWNLNNITGTISLPTGAATSSLQTTGNSSLSSLDSKLPNPVASRVPVDGSGVIQPVSGTVTANQGAPGPTASPWPVSVTNGFLAARQEPNNQISNGNAYVVTTVATTVGTTETNAFYLKNGSSKTIYVFNIFMLGNSANGNNWIDFRAYYNPTVTVNGSSLTITNLLAGSANASTATAFVTSTTSSRGTLVKFWNAGINNSAGVLQDATFSNYFVLPANQSILITVQCKANGQAYDGTLMWFEV